MGECVTFQDPLDPARAVKFLAKVLYRHTVGVRGKGLRIGVCAFVGRIHEALLGVGKDLHQLE
jgi:hypothetical protein